MLADIRIYDLLKLQRFPDVRKLKIWGHTSKTVMFTTLIFGEFFILLCFVSAQSAVNTFETCFMSR